MHGSDSRDRTKVGLITGGLLAAFVALAFIIWGLLQAAEYQRQADYQAREYTADTYQKERQACLGLPARDQAKCVAEARHERRVNQRDEQDLVAQRQSTLWAYVMGAAAVIGMGLSVIGVILVWTTFKATSLAADAARSTHQAFIEVERARLVASADGVYWRDERLALMVKAENIGKSAALIQEVTWWPLATNEFSYCESPRIIPRQKAVFPEKTDNITFIVVEQDTREFPYIGGAVRYSSAFDTGHVSYFCSHIIDERESHPEGYGLSIVSDKGDNWPDDT